MQSPLDVYRADVLAGHVALVTGGGTGICRGIAHAFARFGADVCIVSRKQDVLDNTAAELRAATGREVLAVAADVLSYLYMPLAYDRFGPGVRWLGFVLGALVATRAMLLVSFTTDMAQRSTRERSSSA